jgi:hypothetical protein
MARYKGGEYVPAQPFADWINARVASYQAQETGMAAHQLTAVKRTAEDLGWGSHDGGIRKLYRYRHMLRTVGGGGSRARAVAQRDIPTDKFPRPVVEDALFTAGVDFYEMYPQFAHERDIELEPAAWCPNCRSHVTPIQGECPWDGWRISDGHMNLRAAA